MYVQTTMGLKVAWGGLTGSNTLNVSLDFRGARRRTRLAREMRGRGLGGSCKPTSTLGLAICVSLFALLNK